PGGNFHQRAEVGQRRQQYHHEDVQHRPLADELDHLVHAGALAQVEAAASLQGDRQGAEREDLGQRHHDAGHEDDQGDVPGAGAPEIDYAAQDGVAAVAEEHRPDMHD